jgi:hypothetical protein
MLDGTLGGNTSSLGSDGSFRAENPPLLSAIDETLEGERIDPRTGFERSSLDDWRRGDLDDGTKACGKLDAGERPSDGGELVEGDREGESELYFELMVESDEKELGERKGGDIDASAVKCCTLGSKSLIRAESE